MTIDGNPDIPNDADGVYTDVTIIVEGVLNFDDNNFNNNTSCCGNLRLAGDSGIRLDNGGQIVENIANFREGYGFISLDGDIIWAACDDDGGACENYVVNISGYTLHPDLLYGEPTGDGTLIPATSNPLPVELLSFSAQVNEHSIFLNWTTATELNNDYFEVEKSADANIFTTLGKISGMGNSSVLNHYKFRDDEMTNSRMYYRLKQTDYDGQFEYSNIIVINMSQQNNLALTLYPNPASSYLNIQLDGLLDSGDASASIIDPTGKVIYTQTKDQSVYAVGRSFWRIDNLSSILTPGVYIVQIKNEEILLRSKFMFN